MRNIPFFDSQYGVASLVLKEIPYSGIAYVTVRDSLFPTEFLKECTDFCRAVGAERVYASGHKILEEYPFHTSVFQMTAGVDSLEDTQAMLFPVTEKTVTRWREIYNQKMKGVHNAAHMSDADAEAMLKRGDGYFIHEDGKCLGIGIASGDRIDCVAAVVPGSGRKVVLALTHALMCERILLEVASTNHKAIRLYETLGFIKTAELSRWYKIF